MAGEGVTSEAEEESLDSSVKSMAWKEHRCRQCKAKMYEAWLVRGSRVRCVCRRCGAVNIFKAV